MKSFTRLAWNLDDAATRAKYTLGALALALLVAAAVNLASPLLILGALLFTLVLALRQETVAATLTLLVSLYSDWYLATRVAALVIALFLVIYFAATRSQARPFIIPRGLALWGVFLLLAIIPAARGALTVHDAVIYYPSVIVGALIMYWVGMLVARDVIQLRRFWWGLASFGALIGLHIDIQKLTGVFVLQSADAAAYLASVSDYQLSDTAQIDRLGSFFIQPNFAGMFLAMLAMLQFGLIIESRRLQGKIIALIELLVTLAGLLFTFSASSWIAVIIGLAVFLLLSGRPAIQAQIPLYAVIVACALYTIFPADLNLLFQHASDPSELALRNAVWTTALNVIQAHPWTGVGLGHQAYLIGAEPYRVYQQYLPYDHPHNSYLEWAAMAGIPVLLAFLAVLGHAIWQALQAWRRVDHAARPLIAAGLAAIAVLCFTSFSNQGWTLPPLAALGWMILGALALRSSEPVQQEGAADDHS